MLKKLSINIFTCIAATVLFSTLAEAANIWDDCDEEGCILYDCDEEDICVSTGIFSDYSTILITGSEMPPTYPEQKTSDSSSQSERRSSFRNLVTGILERDYEALFRTVTWNCGENFCCAGDTGCKNMIAQCNKSETFEGGSYDENAQVGSCKKKD
jgi:hypothetical protein